MYLSLLNLKSVNCTQVYQSTGIWKWIELNLKHVSFRWRICKNIKDEASLIFLKYIKAMQYTHIYSIYI